MRRIAVFCGLLLLGLVAAGFVTGATGVTILQPGTYSVPDPSTVTVTTTVTTTPSTTTTTTASTGNWLGSFQASYDGNAPGTTVVVPCGTYGGVALTDNSPAGSNITFTPTTPFCVTIPYIDFSNGGNYSTWQGFVIPEGVIQEGSNYLDGVVINDNHLVVDQVAQGTDNNFHLVNGLQFTNNTIGPSCCSTGSSSPEGLRIGTPGGGSSTNVTISGNTIQYPLRSCQYWPSTYTLEGQTISAGACPGVTCDQCHDDAIHIWGLTNSTIANNQIIGAEVQGIYIENSNGVSGLENANITIAGNSVSLVSGSAGIYVEGNGTQPLVSGTWTISNNTSPNLIEIGPESGMANGTTFNLTGNNTELLISDSSGNAVGCAGTGTATFSYSGNTWVNVAGGTNGCP